mmetsp:Transcript_28764/g.92102  ORF Transcript_28764/g.92102 Transcript_28764/m.92102 type:complete len:225 (-) Transcript_28764:1290-1964(-)
MVGSGPKGWGGYGPDRPSPVSGRLGLSGRLLRHRDSHPTRGVSCETESKVPTRHAPREALSLQSRLRRTGCCSIVPQPGQRTGFSPQCTRLPPSGAGDERRCDGERSPLDEAPHRLLELPPRPQRLDGPDELVGAAAAEGSARTERALEAVQPLPQLAPRRTGALRADQRHQPPQLRRRRRSHLVLIVQLRAVGGAARRRTLARHRLAPKAGDPRAQHGAPVRL